MGANLNTLKNQSKCLDKSPLFNQTLSQLKENFACFKAICENFYMDLTEFEHIFGENESSFIIWDNDKNGLVDVLEVFSGLVVFSNSKFEDKIRFLYEIFDLNEENLIEVIDVEFIVYTVLQSTFKIHQITTQKVSIESVKKFVKDLDFNENEKIKVTKLIKFAKNNKKIEEYFEFIENKDQKKK